MPQITYLQVLKPTQSLPGIPVGAIVALDQGVTMIMIPGTPPAAIYEAAEGTQLRVIRDPVELARLLRTPIEGSIAGRSRRRQRGEQ